jgi:hypothetical protein
MTFRSAKTPPGSAPFRRIENATRARELDRQGWAGSHLVLAAWDTIGSGTITTEPILFGTVFEDEPFFSYGVELQEDETLVDGDYPFTSCGISEWQTTAPRDVDGKIFYLSGIVWISVVAAKSYRLRFRFGFEGIAMRNREYIN